MYTSNLGLYGRGKLVLYEANSSNIAMAMARICSVVEDEFDHRKPEYVSVMSIIATHDPIRKKATTPWCCGLLLIALSMIVYRYSYDERPRAT